MTSALQLAKNIANTLYDRNARGQYLIIPPQNATTGQLTPISVTPSNNDFATAGTIVEVEDSAVQDSLIDGIVIMASAAASTRVNLDIGIGASGSETWLGRVSYEIPSTAVTFADERYLPINPPIYVNTGQRVAVRAFGSANNAQTIALMARARFKSRLNA